MAKNDIITEYCTGCGLCHNLFDVDMKMGENGFYSPSSPLDKAVITELQGLCPCFGKQLADMDENRVWGRRESSFLAYSSNSEIRYNASSGGVLTSICSYLLETKRVDGILHIGKDPDDPIGSKMYCSRSVEQIISNSGSRYTSSMPLYDISSFFRPGEKYAFVGKPCDVAIIRNWSKKNNDICMIVPYLLSFFCAGAPSRNVNIQLLDKMQCGYENCRELTYRGNGWPGYTTAIDHSGQEYKLEYREVWGKTLGRDIRKVCRFCIDGVGELADISCGDAWYLDDEKKPVFTENKGRNIVFTRTKLGDALFKEAVELGYITIEDFNNYEDDMRYSQYHQFFKKKTMLASIIALFICGKSRPQYSFKKMICLSKDISLKLMLKKMLGTIKRIIKGTI